MRQIYKVHHLLIESRYPVSLLTIRAELECSRATANRVIEQLRDQFIAPIKYDREHSGYHDDVFPTHVGMNRINAGDCMSSPLIFAWTLYRAD
ncbi:MAG: HTH domain-containing protein, partial [Pseudomonadota bacterium]